MGVNRPEVSNTGQGNGRVSSELAAQLSDLARELQQDDDVHAVLSGIVQAALDLIPGTAHASISLVTGRKKVDSEVASGDLARQVDALQSSTGQGPCLDAAYRDRVVRVPDLSREDRWPEFSQGAVKLGARSMLSFQLFVEGDRLGALNLYGADRECLRRRIRARRPPCCRARRRCFRGLPENQSARRSAAFPAADRPGRRHPDGAIQAHSGAGLPPPHPCQLQIQHQTPGYCRTPCQQRGTYRSEVLCCRQLSGRDGAAICLSRWQIPALSWGRIVRQGQDAAIGTSLWSYHAEVFPGPAFRRQRRSRVSGPATCPGASRARAVPVDELPWRSTPGTFEIVRADGGGFLLRLVDGNGTVLALSRTYPDISAAVEGVEALREGAATSYISDQTARPPVPTRFG